MSTDSPLVLVCPLDWGLGHASRMIPVIEKYLSEGYRVMIGGSGQSGQLLKHTFPGLRFLDIPSPRINYADKGFCLTWLLIVQLPKLIRSAFYEHRWISEAVSMHHIDVVISDNRYGLFCKKAHTIFITHQLSPVLPHMLRWFEYPLFKIINRIILKYNECWIPDTADLSDSLSGILSHRYKLPGNAKFIGILSRFSELKSIPKVFESASFTLVVVISGPEPQAGKLLTLFLQYLPVLPVKTLIICGNPEEKDAFYLPETPGPTVVSHLPSDQFAQVLRNATAIICRSGYSSIMDLIALDKTALLIPTPGQSEQQYLAKYLSGKGLFTCCAQHELDPSRIAMYLTSDAKASHFPYPQQRTTIPVKKLP